MVTPGGVCPNFDEISCAFSLVPGSRPRPFGGLSGARGIDKTLNKIATREPVPVVVAVRERASSSLLDVRLLEHSSPAASEAKESSGVEGGRGSTVLACGSRGGRELGGWDSGSSGSMGSSPPLHGGGSVVNVFGPCIVAGVWVSRDRTFGLRAPGEITEGTFAWSSRPPSRPGGSPIGWGVVFIPVNVEYVVASRVGLGVLPLLFDLGVVRLAVPWVVASRV